MSGKVPVTVPTVLIDFLKQLTAAQDQTRPFEFTSKLTALKNRLEKALLKIALDLPNYNSVELSGTASLDPTDDRV